MVKDVPLFLDAKYDIFEDARIRESRKSTELIASDAADMWRIDSMVSEAILQIFSSVWDRLKV